MKQRISGHRTRGGNWTPMVKPQDLHMASEQCTSQAVQQNQYDSEADTDETDSDSDEDRDEETDCPMTDVTEQLQDSPSRTECSERQPYSTPGCWDYIPSESIWIPVDSVVDEARETSFNCTQLVDSTDVPSALQSVPSSVRLSISTSIPPSADLIQSTYSSDPPCERPGLGLDEKRALRRIATMAFGSSVLNQKEGGWINLPWMNGTLDGSSETPSVAAMVVLEMHMYTQRPMIHTVFQQLLRQDLGVWALSALRMDNYKLIAAPVQSEKGLCCRWSDSGSVGRIQLPEYQQDGGICWPGANIHFVSSIHGSGATWQNLLKGNKTGGYFDVSVDGKLAKRIRYAAKGVQMLSLMNPIAKALVGNASWEDKEVKGFVSGLFRATENDEDLKYHIDMYTLRTATMAFESSWLSVVTDHHRQENQAESYLSVAVLNNDVTCIPEDEVQTIRKFARRYGLVGGQ